MKTIRPLLWIALGWTLGSGVASRAEVFEANGWRIEKTVQSVTPTSVTYYIDLTRTGADAGVVTFQDERDPAVTDGYGPDADPPPVGGGSGARTIVWTQDMPNGASTYAYLSTVLKPDLPPGTRIANKASVVDSNGMTSVIQTVWVGRDNDTTRASGSVGTCRDPVNTRTGETTYDPAIDFDLGGPLPLRFARLYASRLDDPGTDLVRSALGPGWMHNFDVQLVRQDPAAPDRSFFVILAGGKVVPFTELDDGTCQLNLIEPLTPYALKSDGEDVWFCDPDQGLLYRFDDADRAGVKEIADRNGNHVLIGRRADGLATNAADGLGRELRFEYNAASNLVRVTDGTRAVGFGYGPAGELVAATNALGEAETYAYDPTNSFTNGNGALLASVAFPRGNVPLVQTYDAAGRVVRQADAYGNEATFEYGVSNFTTYGVVTDPDGSAFRHEYLGGKLYKAFDAYSNYFQYGFSGGRDALGSLRDRRGNDSRVYRDYATRRIYEVQDRWYARTQYQHLTNVQVFTNREFPGGAAAFTFHDLWIVTNRNNDNTSSETFFRDARGNVTGYVDKAEQRWNVEVNARGQPTVLVRPGGGTQTFAYNGDGTLASAADSDVGATTYLYDALRRRIGVQHPDGATEGWGLDALNRVTAYTNAAGGVTVCEYDANGNLVRLVDPLGFETREQFDWMDRATNRVDSLGVLAATAYDGMGRPATVADPAGTNAYRYDRRGWATNAVRGARTWTQNQDPEGNVTNLVSPGGATNRYAYNWIGWPSTWYDPLYGTAHAQTATWAYDYRGNPTRVKNQMGETNGYGWDKADRLVVFSNAALQKAYFEYDADGNRTRQTDFAGHATTFSYTRMGRLAAVTNPLGEATRFAYDAAGRPARTTFADGTSRETTYDTAGRPAIWTDEATNAWRAAYDVRGAVVAVTNPAGGVTTYAYNLDGTLRSVADSDVGLVSNRYDAARRLVETVWPDGARVQYAYNEYGELAAILDALGRTNRFSYDADGRLTATVDPLGNTNRFFYDAAGRLTNAVDRTGIGTRYEYDRVGRLTATIDDADIRTAYGRDKLGRVTNVAVGASAWTIERDPNGAPLALQTPLGRRTDFGLDALGRVARVTNALGQTSTRAYDARGRVTAVADPTGRTTCTAYDPRGLPAAHTLPDSNSVAYAWNALGNLARLTDLNGAEWTFAYTPMGRLLSAMDPLFRATLYGYDANGRLAYLVHPGGDSTGYTRDANGQTIRILHSTGPDLRFQRDALGRIVHASLGGTGMDVDLAYDAAGRPTSATHAGTTNGAVYDWAGRLEWAAYANGAFGVHYEYDDGPSGTGRLKRLSDSLTGTQVEFGYDDDLRLRTATLSNGEVITTTWDDLDRLARLQSGEQVDLEMTYDLSGRIVDIDGFAPLAASGHVAAAIAALTFDAASQISSPGYAHDARGRVTATPARTFAWDSASRLTSIVPSTTNHQPSTLSYDAFGQLRTRADAAGTNRFFYNPALAGSPLIAERDEATGADLRYYVWTPGGRLLYVIDAADGNAVYFYHFDATGNTLALTDTNRAVVAAYAYDPYGRILASTGTVTQPFTYSGAWGVRQDGASGTLYQMRARWYDATIGRFLSPEPLWPQLAEPKALNPYQYAGGDPIRFVDPSGLFVNLAAGAQVFTDAQLDAYLAGGMMGLMALLLQDVDLDGLSMDQISWGLALAGVTEENVRRQLHDRFERRKAEHLARHPAPCHGQPFDSQPQRPPDPAQEIAAQLGRVPALDKQTARYQPVSLEPQSSSPASGLSRLQDSAPEKMVGIAFRTLNSEDHAGQTLAKALIDDGILAPANLPGNREPFPEPDPAPPPPLSGSLTELGADDLVAEMLFSPGALWSAGLRPPVRRYAIPAAAHKPIRRAEAPPAAPLPNPGDILDWMVGPEALLDYARSAVAPPPLAPNRFQGRRYPDLQKARNDAFSRVAAHLQAGDMAGAREAMDALNQAERDLTDYSRLYPFSPFSEK
ncbi:MAG: RHS repeat-associated core domain-containing protein [Kiritimatiellia bacterium]